PTQFVPDANATLRITFGRVRGYSPADAIQKTPISTLQGVIDKTTGLEPFITPKAVIDRFNAKDFGGFVHPKLGQVPVAILYNTDTTGGNSGSPVFNAMGELVAVNFDRTFEATINDFAWNESYSRSIGVDIRYVLWITGIVYNAKHLLKEMGL
ncbi:MAG TPA: S46 family peptidase, partial [Pirellula sp.]|nr:S46 family peptidase [Pirellula sp.]